MSEDPLSIEESDGDIEDVSFDTIPQESIRYVQNCGVTSGGFIVEDGSHEPAIFLKVLISRKAYSPAEEDEEVVLALIPEVAHELSEAMHFLSCQGEDEE